MDICFWEAECFKIDAENKKVYCRCSQNSNMNGKEEFVVDYDYLVIAMGARPNTFNTPGVMEYCNFLKVTSLQIFSVRITTSSSSSSCCFLFGRCEKGKKWLLCMGFGDGTSLYLFIYFAKEHLFIRICCHVLTFKEMHFPFQEVEDAQKIRRTVIDNFEKASLPNLSNEERKRILHFVVVGGGPTGVEFAAELHDFVNEDLVKLYPAAKDFVKITLLEAADHILNM